MSTLLAPTVGEIRDAFADQLRKRIAGLRVYDVWPDTVSLPAAVLKPTSASPAVDLDDSEILRMDVHVLVSLAGSLRNAQDALDAYLGRSGPLSLRAAIAQDDRLGDTVYWTHYAGWSSYDAKSVAGSELLGAVLSFEVCF
jgi:hypothetical protein